MEAGTIGTQDHDRLGAPRDLGVTEVGPKPANVSPWQVPEACETGGLPCA